MVGDSPDIEKAVNPTDAIFLSTILQQKVQAVHVESISDESGGSIGDVCRLLVDLEGDRQQKQLILKRTKCNRRSEDLNEYLGLTREVLFYKEIERLVATNDASENERDIQRVLQFLPDVYWTYASSDGRTKIILMEDVCVKQYGNEKIGTDRSDDSGSTVAVQSGLFFGPRSPLNWSKDLVAYTSKLTSSLPQDSRKSILSVKDITESAFQAAAAFHAFFWQDSTLLSVDRNKAWLRSAEWIAGKSQSSWEKSMLQFVQTWESIKKTQNICCRQEDGEEGNGNTVATGESEDFVRWDSRLVSCLDASCAKINWKDYQTQIQSRPFTLVHGDFHPSNIMVRLVQDESNSTAAVTTTDGVASKERLEMKLQSTLLDFEMVGVGCGPQDLGQYMISHTDPSVRVAIEEECIRNYYETLCQIKTSIASSYSFQDCWKDYVEGAVGRWIFLLPFLNNIFPSKAMQYFHDQLLSFICDHHITAETVPMPRQ